AEPVERRRAVEEHGVLLDALVQGVPHLGRLALDQALGALDRGHVPVELELVVDERLEQLQRHLLGDAALVELELGAGHDDRATRVVHALSEEVLTEATLLATEGVREGLERALVRARDRLSAAAVVKEGVNGLLEHPLLVADDDLGGVELDEPTEA